jgi:hypothetical protein
MPDPLAVRSGDGEARWWLGALAVIKATAADTRGHLTIVEVTDPPGVEAPLHVHHKESLLGRPAFGTRCASRRCMSSREPPRDLPGSRRRGYDQNSSQA